MNIFLITIQKYRFLDIETSYDCLL